MEPTVDTLALGALPLTGGGVLEDARLVYATWGRLDPARSNVVLLPTYYTGTHDSYRPWIGEGRAIDPARWFVVSPNLFGNGVSTSPHQSATADERAAFPRVSIADNLRAQRRLLEAHLGVRRIALAMGWSLGAMQALHWAAAWPQDVRSVLAVCGTASCWPLNKAFLASVFAALTADPAWRGGAYPADAPPRAGLRAFGRVYCPWAYSAAFFRERLYRRLGCETLEDFLLAWEQEHLAWDACDLVAMLRTWESGDIGHWATGSAAEALGRIRARVIAMPGSCDAYFTPDEARLEVSMMPNATLRSIESPFGHCAGAPGRFAEETRQITEAARQLLDG